MDVLMSFIYCMMWIGIGVVATLSIQEAIKDRKKEKEKKEVPRVEKKEKNTAPLTNKMEGKLFIRVTFADHTEYMASIEASRKTSPFRVKQWRRFYRWFFTGITELFTLRAINSHSGCFEYFSFCREDIKTIRFLWQPNEQQ